MRKLFNVFRKPWFLPLLAIVLFSLIVWFVGPLVAVADKVYLASSTSRLLVIMVALLLWGLNNLRIKHKVNAANKALTEDLQSDAQSAPAEVNPDEQMLCKRLQESLALLKGSNFDRDGKLYKLPWYIIIGAPGSGKTTAIKNAGLQFPLQDQIGDDPIRGEGGTRYCDWWFTDDAILIDTAGRYTTQDNPKNIETGAWLGFLNRIKKARPKRPLNGIIVTISIQDIISKTATQKSLQSSAIKQRIQELNNHLQMTLPVYVIFSKMDMVAGFSSFFANMEKQDRQQLWGFSSTERQASSEVLKGWFDKEYSVLVENLYRRVNHRLIHETSQQKRSLICEFPRQVQSLQEQLEAFVAAIFSTNQFESPLYLRGVFFLSSTQSESHAQWVTSIAPPELLAPPADNVARETKPYFVQNLFKGFVFSEANIATMNEKVKRRFRFAYTAILFVAFSGFASMLYAWSHSKKLNEAYIAHLNGELDQYNEIAEGGIDQTSNWQSLNEGLTLLRNLPTGFIEGDSGYTFEQGFGLYQGDKLGQQAAASYLDSLEVYFMADLNRLLTDQIKQSMNDDELLYESLKYYLMLYFPQHMEEKGFSDWVSILWQRLYPASQQEKLRSELDVHLKTVLAQAIPPTPIDENLVESAQQALINTPLDLRAYRRIKNDYSDHHKEQFSILGVLGRKSELLFTRPSGAKLSEGVPAFFTFEGFHSGFNVENMKLSQKLADEQWIYGDTEQQELSKEDIAQIRDRVKEHYFQEYRTRWDFFLNDIRLQPFGTINRGRTVVRMLSSADEPLVSLLKNIRKNTALAEVPGLDKETMAAAGKIADNVASSQKSRLERLVPTELIASKAKLPGQEISDYYSEFNSYTEDGASASLLQLQEAMHGLNYYLQKLIYAEDVGQAAFASTSGDTQQQALMQLKIAIDQAPGVLQPWFGTLSKNTQRVSVVAAKSHLNMSWRKDVFGFYEEHLKGRYPLDKHSEVDIELADFTEFFGPGGILDSYFDQYVAPYVDTSGLEWRWKKSSGMSSQALDFFQKAEQVRRAFFNGGEALNVEFAMRPHTLDKTVSGVTLDINGSSLDYQHGPTRQHKFSWPGEDPSLNQLVFKLVSRGTPISVRTEGDWSWFRLLDQYATTEFSNSGSPMLVTFAVNGVTSTQELKPMGRHHPFNPTVLQSVAPPERL